MNVLITGAHFTPAQAVIEELLTQGHEIKISYVGRKSTREGDPSPSVESQVLPKMGVKFIPIVAGRVRRYISIGTFISLLKIPVGFFQAFYILVKEQPDVVVCFGGYVAVPVVFNAWLLNIPIIVHEQTLVSGLANTFSNFFATKIAVSFDQPYSFDKSKLLLSGNPMRKKILQPVKSGSKEIDELLTRAKKTGKQLVLVTGGNQGSHVINEVVEQSLDRLMEKFIVIHQTGDSKYKDYERIREYALSHNYSDNYFASKWISEEDMGILYQSVALAVSRCGANTLLELAYHQVPTLMIPLPSVTKDEQTKNARFFSRHGLGEILLQKDLNEATLVEKINEMIRNKEVKENVKSAKEVVILGAEKKLATEIQLVPYKA